MWKTVRLADDENSWKDVAEAESLSGLQQHTFEQDDRTFHFYVGDLPDSEEESVSLFQQMQEANQGRLSRITIGMDCTSLSNESALLCSGRCFCVVAGGRRRCETYYCPRPRICYWVPCGSSC